MIHTAARRRRETDEKVKEVEREPDETPIEQESEDNNQGVFQTTTVVQSSQLSKRRS